MRGSRAVTWFLVSLLALCLGSAANGARIQLDDELALDQEPDGLTLAPGEAGEVRLTFTNSGDRTLWIAFEFQAVKSPYGSSCEVDRDYFQLEPGGVEVVLLTITSHAHYRESGEGDSDVRLWIVWGPNLTLDPWGGIEDATAEDGQRMDIQVVDDFTGEEAAFIWVWVFMTALTVVAVVVIVLEARRRRGRVVT